MKTVILKIIYFAIICFGLNSSASYSARPQLGVGFTNNANYEDGNENSDFFLMLRNSLTYNTENESAGNLWLGYKSYLKEKQNDAFVWRLGGDYPFTVKQTESTFIFGLGGQHFIGENPASTEETLDNFYGEMATEHSLKIRSEVNARIEPGFQIKTFPRLSGRTDSEFYVRTVLDWAVSPFKTISAFSELGLVFCNDSLYRKNFLEFGIDWRNQAQKELVINLGLLTKFSTFPNRTVNQSTYIAKKRGATRILSRDEIEFHSNLQFRASIVKIWRGYELTGSLTLNSQNSKSGNENYTEYNAIVYLAKPF